MVKYIFVTGGVTSSLGKGIIAASLGRLLQGRGYSVTIQKFDPYINVDPGTLNPYEHGECYVTDDGAETDLDLGHYERFLDTTTSQANNMTTGRIYQTVITKERAGEFLGKTVQVVPHITDEIKRRIRALGQTGDYDIIITEVGGTVGDIESLPYLEALRQLRIELNEHDSIIVHLTLIPYLRAAKELKTKPTQHSVKELLQSGNQPDVLVCRTERPLNEEIRRKLSLFCNVRREAVIEALDVPSIYEVPLYMQEEKLDEIVLKRLGLENDVEPDLSGWKEFIHRMKNPKSKVRIGLVGKYIELQDAYKSIHEAFVHAGAKCRCEVEVVPIHSEYLEVADDSTKLLRGLDGVLVAPGFGERGIKGKLKAIEYVRKHNIPFFGICLGMQQAIVEFAQNVLKLEGASSTEVKPDAPHPIIDLMQEQKKITTKGGTMRLGSYPCKIEHDCHSLEAYGTDVIHERHRHRYEFNNEYLDDITKNGLRPVGINPDNNLVEIVELENHPWFVGVQFHPELKSRVERPHPLFISFIEACMKYNASQGGERVVEKVRAEV
ncbi:MAG: CTP synthase [Bacteroidetes bacterium]|nr:MAG: CTP synthase [Bacteroidota bacterium]